MKPDTLYYVDRDGVTHEVVDRGQSLAAMGRIHELEAALRAVCEAAEYVDPYEEGMDMCELCGGCRIDGEFHHADDCPVAAALALLGDA